MSSKLIVVYIINSDTNKCLQLLKLLVTTVLNISIVNSYYV